MGRGSSGLGSGGDGFERIGSTSVADGSESIDLSESPLRYGKEDGSLAGGGRTAAESFENRYVGAKVENMLALDADGNEIEKSRGGANSVRLSWNALLNAETITHNHPRAAGILGGTFSEQDLSAFTQFKVKTMRAAAKEGIYSISKGKNFDSVAFKKYVREEFAKVQASSENGYNRVNSKSGEMTSKEYVSEHNKVSNKMLVDLHNILINGQKKFGYTYTLERRK